MLVDGKVQPYLEATLKFCSIKKSQAILAQKGEVVELPLLMCLALLELERGGDLLIESPSQGSHHASSQHSWCKEMSLSLSLSYLSLREVVILS